jgi:nucleoid-associated protein YgaU
VGNVQQAVLEFDESVQAPWRPSLRVVAGGSAEEVSRPASRPGAYRNRVACASPAEQAAAPPPATAPAARPFPRRRPAGDARRRPRRGVRGGCARPVPAPVRLTRRARRLAVVLALALGVALGFWLGPLVTGGGGGDLRLTGASTVVVARGDTLWSIAASVAGDDDIRAVVDAIQQVNGLNGTALVPGQVLQLP